MSAPYLKINQCANVRLIALQKHPSFGNMTISQSCTPVELFTRPTLCHAQANNVLWVAQVLVEILSELDVGQFVVKLNHRRLLDAMMDLCGVAPAKFRPICRYIKLPAAPLSNQPHGLC